MHSLRQLLIDVGRQNTKIKIYQLLIRASIKIELLELTYRRQIKVDGGSTVERCH